jgi:hypothetical protein
MAPFIRIGLYFLAGWLGSAGVGLFDAETGTITISIKDAASMLSSGLTLVGSLLWYRRAKLNGGRT